VILLEGFQSGVEEAPPGSAGGNSWVPLLNVRGAACAAFAVHCAASPPDLMARICFPISHFRQGYAFRLSYIKVPHLGSTAPTVVSAESDTPREAGGLMGWAASKAVGLRV
jgi:hypothetical protein